MHEIEFNCVNDFFLEKVLELGRELRVDIQPTWTSKYNSDVKYDYKPFCSNGFEIKVKVSCHSYEVIMFFKYIYQKFVDKVERLNNYLQVEFEKSQPKLRGKRSKKND